MKEWYITYDTGEYAYSHITIKGNTLTLHSDSMMVVDGVIVEVDGSVQEIREILVDGEQ